jgi:Sulfotransferase family
MSFTMPDLLAEPPILIVGCPRSGTCLTARLIGSAPNVCLITEHTNKRKNCPEDQSGILDEDLWRNHPTGTIERIYSAVAGEKRLAIKNPNHTLRVPALKQMFPSARFVFVHRDKEDVIASMTRNNKWSFIRNKRPLIRGLESNNDLRASAETVWDECDKVFQQEGSSADWLEVRYENLLASPKNTVDELYGKLGLGRPDDRILSIIRPREKRKESAPSRPRRKPWWQMTSSLRRLGIG